MKLLLSLIFSIYCFVATAQNKIDFKNYLVNNNIESFTSKFAASIDLNIPDAKSNFNKNQASILIKDFFRNEEIKNYSTQHSGGGNGRSNFEIGKLTTSKNSYRSYLLYNLNGDLIEIVEFRLEKE